MAPPELQNVSPTDGQLNRPTVTVLEAGERGSLRQLELIAEARGGLGPGQTTGAVPTNTRVALRPVSTCIAYSEACCHSATV